MSHYWRCGEASTCFILTPQEFLRGPEENCENLTRLEVFTAMNIHALVLWIVIPCSDVQTTT